MTTLRTKLSILLIGSLALTVVPLLWQTYATVGAVSLHMEQTNFTNLMTLEEENINNLYLNLLSTKVTQSMQRRDTLRQMGVQAKHTRMAIERQGLSAEDVDRLIEVNLRLLGSETVGVDYYIQGKPVPLNDLSKVSPLPGLTSTDLKGRPLSELINAQNLYPQGEFAVFTVPNPSTGEPGPLLAFFMPMPAENGEQSVFVSRAMLSDLEIAAEAGKDLIIKNTQEKFDDFEVYEDGFISMIDAEGRVLAQNNRSSISFDSFPQLPALIAEATKNDRSSATLPSANGDILMLCTYVRALDWVILMAAPMAAIQAPSTTLVRTLASLSTGTVLISILIGLTLLSYAMRPLRLLTRKARALPGMNFSQPGIEEIIARDLPLTQKDEVGQLAQAFALMGESLARNIRELMETTASKERMQGELNAARDIQIGILPPPDDAPNIFGFRASAFLEPAKEVGGDLYDYFTTDKHQVLVMGDVSGKGVPAALFMAMAVTLIRYAMYSGLNPSEAMARINQMLESHNPGNMFVTLFLAVYNPEDGSFEYANGGHCPPYIVGPNGLRTVDGLSGPMVGVMPDLEFALHKDCLHPGEICLLFTDGVTEAMNEEQQLYGEERLMDFLSKHATEEPRALLQKIYADLLVYRGSAAPSDDVTMLAFANR